MGSYELEELPSPSAFRSSPPASPTERPARPDLSIKTYFSPPSSSSWKSSSSSKSSSKRREKGSAITVSELEEEGQASPVRDRIERRRSSRGRRERAKDTFNVMGLNSGSYSRERGYSRVAIDESDYTTPTTLGSLDLDAFTPSCEHDGYHRPPPTLHQKHVSRFRLRLMYTLIPIISIVMLGLYTIIIVEHTQKNILRKIQYPGSGAQAQAQMAGSPAPPQGLLDIATPTTTGSTAGNAAGAVIESQEEGLGPLKTGSDGADMRIGGGSSLGIEGEKPEGWKGVEVPPSEYKNGPTILVPTGAAISITDETPAPQPIPPPPPKYAPPAKQEQQPPPASPASLPSSIPASSLTIPGYPYPLSCGPTPATARSKGCVFDIMTYAWLPPPCYDHNLTTSFITMKSRSLSLSSGKSKQKTKAGTSKQKQTLSTGWRYYNHYTDPTPLDSSLVEQGDVESVYVTWEWHREHCLFMWRKMHRSLLIYGGAGDIVGDTTSGVVRGKEMMMDGYVGDYGHTLKCGDSLRGGEGIDGDEVNTLIRMRFPTCGVWEGG